MPNLYGAKQLAGNLHQVGRCWEVVRHPREVVALPTRVKLLNTFQEGRTGIASEAKRKEGAQMAYVIDCVDGMQVRGETMDELRTNTEQHVAEYHQGEDLDLEAIIATAREE